MLKLFDYLESILENQNNRKWFFKTKLNYYVSEVMETLKIDDANEIDSSLDRAFMVCSKLNIPFSNNFKKVYRFNGEYLNPDWKISALACYLIIINCNPNHESVARAQLYFAMNKAAYR